MKTIRLLLLPLLTLSFFVSCDINSSDDTDIEVPPTYEFERNGESTVAFSGQTTRIKMADELFSAMLDFENTTEELLLQMYRNQNENGNEVDPYSEEELNASTKSIKSKVADSRDYFTGNATLSAEIKNDFETWLIAQVEEVFPNRNLLATPGVPGQIADGSKERYINGQGLEYNQMVAKSLNGALMADQMLNNYLSPAVLDEASNREENDNGETEEGSNYTTMEHKWDEAYGYIFGTSANPANPIATIGSDDIFLNKYSGQVSEDDDFSSLAEDMFEAFKLGRAAIVAGDYEVRDEQAAIIQESISKVIGVRAVYYLQAGKRQIEDEQLGSAFHSLSEGYGFIYSLQFTRIPGTEQPYLSSSEVEAMLTDLLDDGQNGLWDVETSTLDDLSEQIADKFDFTLEEAASN
ncbi:DUF4856 domain-containing protein [Rhodohalobacter sp.]|uniref:DUF4856 domain-containing protein n=1 Tax=Rhodohalobacter sp. TaxID=1974210 RepID=UPI002ACD957C|nr:DUF4856 domain-containing protein [Rhodohalobacter sp.]MDZ7755921.1 DUF4856 domain-containing protein [Rhodohalobacter sp.]